MASDVIFGKAGDFIDADYLIVSPDGREEPAPDTAYEPFTARSGMETLRNRTFVEARDPARAGSLFWTAGLALAAAAFWISGGHALFTSPAATARLSPPAHMRIAGWNSQISQSGVNPTLMIDGEVVNEGSSAELLPSLEIEVASANGTRTHYKLGTGDTSVDAQGTFPFSGRLHLPKDGVKTVSVSFAQ